MQKIIIDTNVIVSSLIQRSYPFRIVYELLFEDKVGLCVSPALLAEYRIEAKAIRYKPTAVIDLIYDKDDNKILELADECAADFIITGNTNDFTFPLYRQTRIVTPSDYWENYRLDSRSG